MPACFINETKNSILLRLNCDLQTWHKFSMLIAGEAQCGYGTTYGRNVKLLEVVAEPGVHDLQWWLRNHTWSRVSIRHALDYPLGAIEGINAA
jgi:hypothetical protein